MFDVDVGSNIDLDISLAHPWSSEIYPSSAEKIGAAASLREARKKAKYDHLKLPGGSTSNVIPLVLEHFGTWGEQGVKFLKKLSNQSSDEAGRPNAPEFLDFWRKRFSIQLQKCNAQVISKKLSGLCGRPEKPMALSTQVFPH